jgi:hypothetical protein
MASWCCINIRTPRIASSGVTFLALARNVKADVIAPGVEADGVKVRLRGSFASAINGTLHLPILLPVATLVIALDSRLAACKGKRHALPFHFSAK